ncbi:MAG: PKD domain-containing protein, partial [Bacteroidota bacterium]
LQHSYLQAGDYQVEAAVEGSFGCRDTARQLVSVFPRCEASFTFSQSEALTLDLVGSPQGINSLFYSWSFGDGTFSPGAQVSHTYTVGADYLVCLSIFDTALNCFDLVCDTIFVGDLTNCVTTFTTTALSNKSFFFEADRDTENSDLVYTYTWDFGDGSPEVTGESVSHTYTEPGLYFVMLTTTSDIGCVATQSEAIRADPDPVCNADFLGVEQPNLKAIFTALFPRDGLDFEWSIGGTPVSNSPTLTYQAATPGLVDICLVVSDDTNACLDTTCQTFELKGDQNCTPSFTWNGTGLGPYQFINQSVGGEIGDQAFLWDFGDGSTTTERDPNHTFLSGNSWEVCLTIRNLSTGCSDQQCRIVSANPGTGFEISGVSYADQMPVYDANALLYTLDGTGSYRLDVIQPYLASGLFRFENVQAGNYQIWIHPKGEEVEKYLPTYPGNQLYWQDAIGTVVSQSNIALPPIEMNVKPTRSQGQGSIRGRLFEGLQALNGPPLAEQVMFLLDQNQVALTYVLTDVSGSYNFEALPLGTYFVRPEIPGIYSQAQKVILGGTAQVEEIDFGVGQSFSFPASNDPEQFAIPVFGPSP